MASQPVSLPTIMTGVNNETLSPEAGRDIAPKCRVIFLANDIKDAHIILYESKYHRLAGMYRPAISANPAATVSEPFSTTLGIPICKAKTTSLEGTGGVFFIDTAKPGILFPLTARHVLFHPDREENTLYKYRDRSGGPQKKVMFMGEAAFRNRCETIEPAIEAKKNDHRTATKTLDGCW